MADIVEIKIHNNLVDVINKNRQSKSIASPFTEMGCRETFLGILNRRL